MAGAETRDSDGFARSVLHHAIAHGDRIGRDAEGRVVIALAIPEPEFDALAAFDPDGDGDVEPDADAEIEPEGGDDTVADMRRELA